MTDVTVVLVHGFWGGAAHWGKVIVDLHARGYSNLRAVELPLTSLADDAERTRKMVEQIQGPVLLVGHSYGGAVITEMGGPPQRRRAWCTSQRLHPIPAKARAASPNRTHPAAAANLTPDSDGYLWIIQEKYRESFCQDLDVNDSLIMAVTQKAPLASTFGDAVTAPAWKVKPSWYQVSSEDRMIHPDNERMMAGRMNPRKLVELPAGHASLASQPSAVTDLIVDALSDIQV